MRGEGLTVPTCIGTRLCTDTDHGTVAISQDSTKCF